MEELPNYFDVIVIGTGMPECIIAAAAARVGKTVLHLERNGYYGGDWASFSFDKFLEWIEETKDIIENSQEENNEDNSLTSFLNENERLAFCRLKSNTISNLVVKSFISDTASPTTHSNPTAAALTDAPVPHNLPEVAVESASTDDASSEEAANDASTSAAANDASSNESDESRLTEESDASSIPSSNAVDIVPVQPEWTISQFIENRRKFNIDLSPKLMFSRGSLVELLISSNIARYAEFQCVNRVLTYINGHIEQVPCSRADVFSTKNVTVVEKRMLMKFLTFCLKFEEHEDEFKGFEEAPFFQFLRSKKLTPNVEHYIMHAIAMVNESCSTLEGLKATQKFLQSLGRYGKSPFLCTCYGSAELPQCFCRLCAVYGGMYYLKRNIEAIVLNSRCCGIVSMNQRIGCQWLVMESSYCPVEFMPSTTPQRISKAILITDESLYPAEKKENILLKLTHGPSNSSTVTVLEFSSKTYVCPEDLYIVYMYCRSSSTSAEDDLKPIADLLFHQPNASGSSPEVKTEKKNTIPKPNVLWCVYFNQMDTSTVDVNSSLPEGLYVTSSPDVELDYEHAVNEAREIFEKMCPGEEFLPRAPDPEDILIESHNNAGDEGGKIENDVSQPDNEITESTESVADSNTENELPDSESVADSKTENELARSEDNSPSVEQ